MPNISTYLDETGLAHFWSKIKLHVSNAISNFYTKDEANSIFLNKTYKPGLQLITVDLYHYDFTQPGADDESATGPHKYYGDRSAEIQLNRPHLEDGQYIKMIEIVFMDNDKNTGSAKTIRKKGLTATDGPWNDYVALSTSSMPAPTSCFIKCKHVHIVDTEDEFKLETTKGWAMDGSIAAPAGEACIQRHGETEYTDVYETNHIGITDVIGYL